MTAAGAAVVMGMIVVMLAMVMVTIVVMLTVIMVAMVMRASVLMMRVFLSVMAAASASVIRFLVNMLVAVFFCEFPEHFICQAMTLFHGFADLRAGQRIPGGGDNGGFGVVLPQHRYGSFQFVLRDILSPA